MFFLGLAGFALLVFFTGEKPKQIVANDNVVNIIKYDSLPTSYELVGKDENVRKETLLKKNQKNINCSRKS